MDVVWMAITLIFFGVCLAYVGFLAKEGKTPESATLEEMEAIWQAAKKGG